MLDGKGGHGGNIGFALDLVFFEQWLRFYFITQRDGRLYLDIPEEAYGILEKEHPDLFPVAKALNGRVMDHQTALEALSESMLADRAGLDGGQWAEILGGLNFHITLELMGFWVQSRETELDRENYPFTAWKDLFMSWRSSPEVEDYAARVRREKQANAGAERAGESGGGFTPDKIN